METDCGRIRRKRQETIHSFITSTSLSSSRAPRDLEELQSLQPEYGTFLQHWSGVKGNTSRNKTAFRNNVFGAVNYKTEEHARAEGMCSRGGRYGKKLKSQYSLA